MLAKTLTTQFRLDAKKNDGLGRSVSNSFSQRVNSPPLTIADWGIVKALRILFSASYMNYCFGILKLLLFCVLELLLFLKFLKFIMKSKIVFGILHVHHCVTRDDATYKPIKICTSFSQNGIPLQSKNEHSFFSSLFL